MTHPTPADYDFKSVHIKSDTKRRLRSFADEHDTTYTDAIEKLLDDYDERATAVTRLAAATDRDPDAFTAADKALPDLDDLESVEGDDE